MSEKYGTYKSRQRRNRSGRSKKNSTYPERLRKQLIISCTCFAVIYLMNASNTYIGKAVNQSIKSALDYRMNTDGMRSEIRKILDGMIIRDENSDKKANGDKLNEKTEENSVFENL